MTAPLTIEQALKRYPLHPTAWALVYERASRRLLDDPEESPEQAVQAALVGLVVQCAGCGLYVAPGSMVVMACDLCSQPVCSSCVRALVAHGPDGPVGVAMCPRCFSRLPRRSDDIAAMRRYILREANRPPWWPQNGRHPWS